MNIYRRENWSTFEVFNVDELHSELESLKVEPTGAAKGQKVPIRAQIGHWCAKIRCLCLAFQENPEDSSLINQAIDCAEQAFSACKDAKTRQNVSNELFALVLEDHAHALAIRFKLFQASDDLDRIIEIYREAVATYGSRSKGRAQCLNALAQHQLIWRHRNSGLEIYGDIPEQTLFEASKNARAAYDSPVTYSGVRGLYANTLIIALTERHQASGDLSFLDEAVQIASDSLATLPHNECARSMLEATKCDLLFQRFVLRPSAALYNEAMNAARQHSQHDPLKIIDGPRQVTQILRAANTAFEKKCKLQEVLPAGDVFFVKQQCQQILDLDRANTIFRVWAGMILGPLLSGLKEWEAATKALEKTTRLLKRLVTRSLSRIDQEWLLRKLSTLLPSMAGYVALCAAEAAGSTAEEAVLSFLQHSESSRGILARLVFQSRLNLERFRLVDKQTADEYHRLLNVLPKLEVAAEVYEEQSNGDKRRANVIEMRGKVAQRISELENKFGKDEEVISVDFLKSLVGKSAFAQVKVSSGIAVSVLLVTSAGLRRVKLRELNPSDVARNLDRLYGKNRLAMAKPLQVEKNGRELGGILKWLWDCAVKPILSELGYYPKPKRDDHNRLPRLWWCASGLMTKLPFHAAGEGAESVNSENIYGYAVSSYTSSLMAFKMAQDCNAPSEKLFDDGMLAVSMPTTPGPRWVALKAEEELRSIKDAANIIPTSLANPTRLDVVKRLSEYSVIHFICHGTSIVNDPSSSALVLGQQDAEAAEHLSVKQMGDINLEKPRIAYLSACSTAENSSYELLDESIHLANAFQLAGFPHVIATFWEAKSRGAIPLAGFFYQKLAQAVAELKTFERNHDVVAHALHDALCEVRKSKSKSKSNPLFWAPFVHIGA